MDEEPGSCNFLYSTVMVMSTSGEPVSFPLKKTVLLPIYRKIRKGLFSPPAKDRIIPREFEEPAPPDLHPGEWAQVRSIDEIAATLDENDKYKGLYFMPEMKRFCEGTYRVFKKVETIKLESTGEVRRLLSPTVFLEGVYCQGERHRGCDRACFHFWREAWLRRVPDGG